MRSTRRLLGLFYRRILSRNYIYVTSQVTARAFCWPRLSGSNLRETPRIY